MKVTSRITQEHAISDDDDMRVATVHMTDEAPGKGRLSVVCNGMSYTCYWSAMGDLNVLDFFKAASDDYVVGCLDPFGTLFRRIDPAVITGIIADDISKSSILDDAKKLELIGRLQELAPISDVNGLAALNGPLMASIYGPHWANQVNQRFLGKHPAYTELLSRIALIRSALVG